ncbi:MAG: glycosyltransferase family 2 protein [Proteobacteria bacterium]|nr:glycosyltransferase family 2 protein [Pseudomonadota bacterium]
MSVVIATYNRLAYLPQSIDSMLGQSWSDAEIIIVDDASTDGTELLLRQRYGDRLVYLRHPVRLGPSEARNTGIAAAGGELIAFHDSDDVAYPRRLEMQETAFSADPELVIVGGQVDYYDVDLKEIIDSPKMLAAGDLEIRLNGLFLQPVSFGSCMMKAQPIRRHGLRLNPLYPAAEDYDFVLQLLRHGRARNLTEPTIKYRCHNDQQSSLVQPQMQDIQKRISDARLAEIGIEVPAEARKVLEFIVTNPQATFKDFGVEPTDQNILMLLVQSYRMLLQVLEALARSEDPRPGELAALRQCLRERCLAAIAV